MKTIRVAVTGGRKHEISGYEESELYLRLTTAAFNPDGSITPVVLLHGNCSGVDQRAAKLAEDWGFATVPFQAPWDRLVELVFRVIQVPLALRKGLRNIAGPLRNWMMLQATDLLVAFPGGRGTADCVRQAREFRVPVVEIADPATVPEKYRIEPDGTED